MANWRAVAIFLGIFLVFCLYKRRGVTAQAAMNGNGVPAPAGHSPFLSQAQSFLSGGSLVNLTSVDGGSMISKCCCQ
jgi:hypothetical protein